MTTPTDPRILTSEAAISRLVRQALAEFRQSFGEIAPPATMPVEQAAAHLSIGATTLRGILVAHPELRITIGSRHLVKMRLPSEWLETQTSIAPATRLRPAGKRRAG